MNYRAQQIFPKLFISGYYFANSSGSLDQVGISHVVNLSQQPLISAKEGRFSVLNLDLDDEPMAQLIPVLQKAIPFIEQGMLKGKVLVNCRAGISRSSSVVIGYLMHKTGMSLQSTLLYLRMVRPGTNPNSGFLDQLRTFRSELNRATL